MFNSLQPSLCNITSEGMCVCVHVCLPVCIKVQVLCPWTMVLVRLETSQTIVTTSSGDINVQLKFEATDEVITYPTSPGEGWRRNDYPHFLQVRKWKPLAVRKLGHSWTHYVSVRSRCRARSPVWLLLSTQHSLLHPTSSTSRKATKDRNGQNPSIPLPKNSRKCISKYASLLTGIAK